jgi:hypothetical protein
VAIILTIAALAGQELDLVAIHPFRRPLPKTPEQRAREDRDGWRMLGAALGQIAKRGR